MLQLILTTLLISVCRSYEIPLNPISHLPVEQDLIDKTDLLPESSECCYTRVGSFSLGGEPIFRGEFPSLALLHYVNLERNSSFPCAGTLISKQYVVTAGHCVTGQILKKAGKLVGVRLGEYDWSKTTCSDGKCNGGVLELEIGKIIPHKEYVDTQKSHDIALIRLAKPLDHFQYNISPTCLRWVHKPLSVTSVPNEKFTVVGWGQTLNEQQSKVANKVYLPHYDLDQCARYYKRYNVNLTDKQICAGGEFKVDACGGDSGGPLITNIGECDYLDGIVSFGRGCGLENWPGVYTNITAYRDWIMENLEP